MGKPLFRKKALEKSSTEDLDKLVSIIHPKKWIALIVLLAVIASTILWSIFGSINTIASGTGIYLNLKNIHNLLSPVKGKISEIAIIAGQQIHKGDVIGYVWNEKEQKKEEIVSPEDGFLLFSQMEKGRNVESNEILAYIQAKNGNSQEDKFYCFLPAKTGDKVRRKMKALLYPWGIDRSKYGGIMGVVDQISYFPASSEYFKNIYLSEKLAGELSEKTALLPIVITPERDPTSVEKFLWSSQKEGPQLFLGSFVTVDIIIESKKPIFYLLPFLEPKESASEK